MFQELHLTAASVVDSLLQERSSRSLFSQQSSRNADDEQSWWHICQARVASQFRSRRCWEYSLDRLEGRATSCRKRLGLNGRNGATHRRKKERNESLYLSWIPEYEWISLNLSCRPSLLRNSESNLGKALYAVKYKMGDPNNLLSPAALKRPQYEGRVPQTSYTYYSPIWLGARPSLCISMSLLSSGPITIL